MKNPHKTSVIAIIGAPNAGKSTLLNKLVGQKISIVTPKVQTTRIKVKGIITEKDTQLVFVDTPGIFQSNKKLDKAMIKSAWSSIEEVEMVILLVDSRKGIDENLKKIIRILKDKNIPELKLTLVLNKIDLVEKPKLLELTKKLSEEIVFDATFMISAKSGDGIQDLKDYLKKNARESAWPYPEHQVTDLPMHTLAAEITREKLMYDLQHEIPYMLMVQTESYKEAKPNRHNKRGSITINQVIYVANESHKKIVVGKGGQQLRKVGEKSRKELEKTLGTKVNLFLFVKVHENWQDNIENYEETEKL